MTVIYSSGLPEVCTNLHMLNENLINVKNKLNYILIFGGVVVTCILIKSAIKKKTSIE